jgi:hypothetical protein
MKFDGAAHYAASTQSSAALERQRVLPIEAGRIVLAIFGAKRSLAFQFHRDGGLNRRVVEIEGGFSIGLDGG